MIDHVTVRYWQPYVCRIRYTAGRALRLSVKTVRTMQRQAHPEFEDAVMYCGAVVNIVSVGNDGQAIIGEEPVTCLPCIVHAGRAPR